MLENPAPVDYPVHNLIRDRWSPRAFSEKPVPHEALVSLFEAARWAPSSSNEQPWTYLVATREDRDNFLKIVGVLVEFNAAWASHAAVLALALAHTKFEKTGAPNRNGFYDVGAATALLSVEATARGLVVHQMAGFDPDQAKKVFGVPEDWEPIAAIAIGYPGDPGTLSEKLRQREVAPRTRKPIQDFVMTGGWGHPAGFVSK